MGIVSLTLCGLALLTIGVLYPPTPRLLLRTGMVLVILSVLTFSLFTLLVGCSLLLNAFILRRWSFRPPHALMMVFGTVGVVILLVAVPQLQRTMRRLNMREQYAYVSLRENVAPVNPLVLTVPEDAEESVSPYQSSTPTFFGRARAIRSLHRSAVNHFLETPEFGVTRMAYPSLRALENDDGSPITLPVAPTPTAPPYPGLEAADDLATEELPTQSLMDPLGAGHVQFSSWFLDEDRFGDVKDLDHVAGFLPHAMVERKFAPWDAEFLKQPFSFTSTGEQNPPWTLVKLQLVGLLYHERPVVYVLDTLPELLTADTAEIRRLDTFEVRALDALQTGDTIHVEQMGTTMRMLGALRSAASCQQCHEGPPNQLLGAFSYELRIQPAVDSMPATGELTGKGLVPEITTSPIASVFPDRPLVSVDGRFAFSE